MGDGGERGVDRVGLWGTFEWEGVKRSIVNGNPNVMTL